jgi:hypothetical protein
MSLFLTLSNEILAQRFEFILVGDVPNNRCEVGVYIIGYGKGRILILKEIRSILNIEKYC